MVLIYLNINDGMSYQLLSYTVNIGASLYRM